MLRRQRAIEIVPSSKPLRWRRYDVPQHLAPEPSDALRFCAVERDLDLLDRRHRSTIKARPPLEGVPETGLRSWPAVPPPATAYVFVEPFGCAATSEARATSMDSRRLPACNDCDRRMGK